MREFSEFEKELIRRINSRDGNMLPNLIDPYLRDVSISISQTEKCTILFQEGTILNLEIEDRVFEIESIIIQSVNLIKLLEDKGYLFTIKRGGVTYPFKYGTAAENWNTISYDFPDERISQLLANYSIKELFVTPELNVFVENNFKTREEIRFNKQFKLALCAICVAFLGLIVNFGFNLEKVINKNDPKIDSLQFKQILDKNHNAKIDSVQFKKLIETLKTNKGSH
jgi:hypothetical protein